MSIQLQMILLLIILLSTMILTALSKSIPKNYPFPPPSFKTQNHSASSSRIERLPAKSNHLFSFGTLFRIELFSPPETTSVVEIRIHRPHTPTLKIRVLTQTPTKVDKATR